MYGLLTEHFSEAVGSAAGLSADRKFEVRTCRNCRGALFYRPSSERNGLGVASFSARRRDVCRREGCAAKILNGSHFLTVGHVGAFMWGTSGANQNASQQLRGGSNIASAFKLWVYDELAAHCHISIAYSVCPVSCSTVSGIW